MICRLKPAQIYSLLLFTVMGDFISNQEGFVVDVIISSTIILKGKLAYSVDPDQTPHNTASD